MITDFLKTGRSKEELQHALEVIREFKECESNDELSKLEQLKEFLAHLVEGASLADDTVEYMKRSNVPHEGATAASSRTLPLDAVVGRRTDEP